MFRSLPKFAAEKAAQRLSAGRIIGSATLATTILVLPIASWVYYDYNTMSKMRCLKGWEWETSLIRGKNMGRETVATIPFIGLPVFTLSELGKYCGHRTNSTQTKTNSNRFPPEVQRIGHSAGGETNTSQSGQKTEENDVSKNAVSTKTAEETALRPTYIAAGNIIFDVSTSEAFQDGGMYEQFSGKDATLALVRMSLDDKLVGVRVKVEELNEQERASLDSWLLYFREKYPVVGVLKEE